jgi:hypothetical protein
MVKAHIAMQGRNTLAQLVLLVLFINVGLNLRFMFSLRRRDVESYKAMNDAFVVSTRIFYVGASVVLLNCLYCDEDCTKRNSTENERLVVFSLGSMLIAENVVSLLVQDPSRN